MTNERFEAELRETLRELASTNAPGSLRSGLAQIVHENRPSTIAALLPARAASLVLDRSMAFALIAAAAVLAAFVGAQVLGTRTQDPAGSSGQNAVAWSSGLVSLTAREFWLTAGGVRYVARGPVAINSDPGDVSYRTLEMTWHENGHEMRLNLYVEANAEKWWVSEIRTYNSQEPPDWITYSGPLFTSARGEPFRGDIELTSSYPDARGSLHFRGLVLDAMPRVEDGPASWTADCKRATDPSNEPDADGGITRQIVGKTAQAAAGILQPKGLCVSWRFQYRLGDSGGNTASGYSEVWCAPPPGVVTGTAYGSSGELVVFVSLPGDPVMPLRSQPPSGWGC